MLGDEQWEGPREKLERTEICYLSDAELLALVFGTGLKGMSVLALAHSLLESSGGLLRLSRRGYGELRREPGIGPTKASRLLAAFELGRRAASEIPATREAIRSSRDVVSWLGPRLLHEEVEHFIAIPLDARHRPLGLQEHSKGGMVSCEVTPADIFRRLLREGAPAVIFVHNHPSGDPNPSQSDITLTERLALIGELLGIHVLDHIIIAREGFYSFLDEGLLEAQRQIGRQLARSRSASGARERLRSELNRVYRV